MGRTVWSPSYGPTSQPGVAAAAAADVHESLAAYFAEPARAVPPPPDPALAMRDGAERVDLYLEQSDLPAEPDALFALSNDTFAKQFDELARKAGNYTTEGLVIERGAIFAALGAKLKARAAALARTFSKALKDWPIMRDPGRQLLLARARPDVLATVGVVATAQPRFGLELLRQLLPADPADEGDRQLIESIAAVLWTRRTEWGVDPRLAEGMAAEWRRMVARYRDANFYAGYYCALRVDRMARAYVAATNSFLQHGVLDPTQRVPLVLAFRAPEDPVALVAESLPTSDAEDTLVAFGLKPVDATGRVGGTRSSEGVGPVRIPDAGSRAT
jgi:hypothetical protein